jgi:sugar lactone lactonase YvrE
MPTRDDWSRRRRVCLWVALNCGGAVRRYAPEGVIDEVVEVPARKATACTFGGQYLDDCSSRRGGRTSSLMSAAAGALFRSAVGVTGMPVREFAG